MLTKELLGNYFKKLIYQFTEFEKNSHKTFHSSDEHKEVSQLYLQLNLLIYNFNTHFRNFDLFGDSDKTMPVKCFRDLKKLEQGLRKLETYYERLDQLL